MTKDEVKQFLMVIQATYPNFSMNDKQSALNAWHMFLQEYDSNQILAAFKAYVQSNGSGFAPSVSQILSMLRKPAELNEIEEGVAWAMVRNAIGRGSYYAKEEFDKLPATIKRAVGSADQIHNWATDENYDNNVVMGIFTRNYRNVLAREKEFNALPPEMQLQVDTNLMIGERYE